MAVELALAHPRAPQDPYKQAPESIGETVRPGIGASQPWLRDPQSHAWTRQATEASTPMTHGMPAQRTVTASPEQSRQLDAAAQRVIADNTAHSPQGIAQRYQEAYAQHGWKQHGPVPAAVTNATPAPVREEPNATRQQVPAPPQPASGHLTPQQIERIDQPGHPGHDMFKQARRGLVELNANLGVVLSEERTDKLAAGLAASAALEGITRIDHVCLGTDGNDRTDSSKIFAAQGKPGSVFSKVAGGEVMPFMDAPLAQSSQTFVENQQQREALDQRFEQKLQQRLGQETQQSQGQGRSVSLG
ncbi:hypothetical protein ASC78_04085 [Variovorax sp. Root318D1]|uniref:XVIPCD domain-containing protein n=1 Tax=Variovorax sp. Root318D1 TaxID=1736513 RepID=UPI0006F4976B|nr:XVIPCD domain-containing protein [Variovorax sp. Root318D1]KQU86753.1 hypothetical protein ASC78_04085 [Variovorax sp. Root318D1]